VERFEGLPSGLTSSCISDETKMETGVVEAFVDASYRLWLQEEKRQTHGDFSEKSLQELHFSYQTKTTSDHHQPLRIRVLYCPPYPLAPDQVMDTTGAGDAFVAATLFSLISMMGAGGYSEVPSPQKVMAFASFYAACNCTKMGARAGLLHSSDLLHSVKNVKAADVG